MIDWCETLGTNHEDVPLTTSLNISSGATSPLYSLIEISSFRVIQVMGHVNLFKHRANFSRKQISRVGTGTMKVMSGCRRVGAAGDL
jgi:hypothetical protein